MQCYVISPQPENTIQEFYGEPVLHKISETNWYEFDLIVYLGLIDIYSNKQEVPQLLSKVTIESWSRLSFRNMEYDEHIFTNWKQNIHFSRKSLIVPKKEASARKTTFSQAEIRHESGRLPSDQMKVSEKTRRAKKASTKYDKVLRIKQLFG